MEPWIAAIAAAQFGVISKSQIESMEISRSKVRTHLQRGWLVAEAPRVYAVVGSPYSWERCLMAGLLCLGDQSWVSHEAAAALHKLDRALKDPVEFTVLRKRRGLEVPFTVHTTAALPLVDVVTIDKFRCISATRTIVDLARLRISRYRLEAAIDSAVRSGASSPVVLAQRLSELRSSGRWGVRLLDRLLVDSGGHTMLERRFLELVREAGLPRPTTQVVFRRDGRAFARVDFRFEQYRVVVEVSGRKGHSSPSERAKDAQRRNELQDAGHAVYEYTWEDVTARRSYVVTTLTARLHRAGWRR
jgi:very-short-patch-repair endonuclease